MKLIKCECCGGNKLRKYKSDYMMCEFCGSLYQLDKKTEAVVSKKTVEERIMSIFTDAERCCNSKRYKDAVNILKKAVRIDENNALVWVKLGKAYRECDMQDEALECYNKAISIDPDFPTAYSNIGTIFILRGDYQAALEKFEKALSLMSTKDGDYPTVLANYGVAVGNTGDKKQAAILINKAENQGYPNAVEARKMAGLSSYIQFTSWLFNKK